MPASGDLLCVCWVPSAAHLQRTLVSLTERRGHTFLRPTAGGESPRVPKGSLPGSLCHIRRQLCFPEAGRRESSWGEAASVKDSAEPDVRGHGGLGSDPSPARRVTLRNF